MALRYLFVDMNSFFASVEQQERPELRGQPVGVVATLVETTCCIAASYEAKTYHIKTGTGVREARQRCPHLRLVEARPELYVRYHHRIVEAVESCLHVDRILSIDEMFGRLLGRERRPERAAEIAYQVKAAIRQATGPCLRCSIGLASNVWLAKVAGDLNKPDGMTVILPQQMPAAICHLALTDLPGIAANMERRLRTHGIASVAQLCQASETTLAEVWGSGVLGSIWWHQLRGHDLPDRPTHRRTVGHSHVLPPWWRTEEGARAVAVRMVHKAAERMRRLGYRAGRLTLSIDFLGGGGWESWASLGLCRDTLTMVQALARLWVKRPPGTPLWIGVTLSHLLPDAGSTLPLFGQGLDLLADAMDRINARHGHHAIYLGGMWGATETAPTRISYTQIPELGDF